MAEPVGPVISGSSTSQYQIGRTMPDMLLRHDISDEELDMLCEKRRDNIWEGMWVAIGALVASSPATIAALANYAKATEPMPLFELVQIVIFFVAAVVSAILFFVNSGKGRRVSEKQKEIRERSRLMQSQ